MCGNYCFYYVNDFTGGISRYHLWRYYNTDQEAIDAAINNPNAVRICGKDGELVWELKRGESMT